MWPRVNVKKGKIEDMGFVVIRMNEAVCKDPSTCIKEIIMLSASGENVLYDEENVPLVVNYNTPFGQHTILFSTKQDLSYKIEIGNQDRHAKFTSKQLSTEINNRSSLNTNRYVTEGKLTEMFKGVFDSVT